MCVIFGRNHADRVLGHVVTTMHESGSEVKKNSFSICNHHAIRCLQGVLDPKCTILSLFWHTIVYVLCRNRV